MNDLTDLLEVAHREQLHIAQCMGYAPHYESTDKEVSPHYYLRKEPQNKDSTGLCKDCYTLYKKDMKKK